MACVAVAYICIGCTGGQGEKIFDNTGAADRLSSPRYAKVFSVRQIDNGVRLVDVADPQTDEDQMPATYHFALIPNESDATAPEGYEAIRVPISRTIVMTMLQLSNFTLLDAHDVVSNDKKIR